MPLQKLYLGGLHDLSARDWLRIIDLTQNGIVLSLDRGFLVADKDPKCQEIRVSVREASPDLYFTSRLTRM
jgi:hypothetical protein